MACGWTTPGGAALNAAPPFFRPGARKASTTAACAPPEHPREEEFERPLTPFLSRVAGTVLR